MGDPYWRYAASADPGSVARQSFPGFLSTETSTLTTPHHLWSGNHMQAASSDYMQKDVLSSRPGAYSVDELAGIGVRAEPGFGGLSSGASIKGYPSPLEDPTLISQRRDAAARGLTPAIPDIINERPSSLRKVDGLSGAAAAESNVLFVDGLPNDCSRREVGHLFRPFIGFREIRVVHKEPRRSGDKATVLCFVEFTDAKCALTALEALQGYKFDNKKPDSPVLRIHFAHFPFRLPADRP